jgi:DNA polymerase III delta prime subunit
MANISVEEYVEKTRRLLELEHTAEVEQSEGVLRGMRPETAQRKGRALLGLRCVDLRGGLLGKTVVTLEMAKRLTPAAPPLPPHKLSPHDVVAIRPSKGDASGEPLCSGVVYRVRDTAVEVVVDDAPDALDGALRVERLANTTSHQRLVQALERVGKAPSFAGGGGGGGGGGGPGGGGANSSGVGVGARLVEVMFGNAPPRFGGKGGLGGGGGGGEGRGEVENSSSSGASIRKLRPINTGLDQSQLAAVEHALSAADVALIHGPPGTGKTTAVVEYIAQEVARGARVLACTASNIAVDDLVERLMKVRDKLPAGSGASAKIVRLGHPARLLPSVLDASLEAQVLRSDNSALARDCEKECRQLRARLLKLGPKDRAERGEARRELRRLAKEEKARQRKAVDEVIRGSNVVCATLAGALSYSLRHECFDVVVIDEAAQALEAACWGAMLKGRKAVLAGDHLQLPPTVLSDAAARGGLSETLFARVHAKWGAAGVARMLTVQYRMNEHIMRWASDELYEGRLTASPSVAYHTLNDAGDGTSGRNLTGGGGGGGGGTHHPVLMLVDTAGCDMEEHCEEEGDSKDNPGEAAAVMALVRRLIRSGAVAAEDIGVITPYSAQVGVLRDMRAADDSLARLEISTVDGFQGREKEAVVISAVRSNPRGEVGFLSDVRRMNVAVTRARRHCCLVCDTDTVARVNPFLQRLVAHFEAHGEYLSAAELEDEAH